MLPVLAVLAGAGALSLVLLRRWAPRPTRLAGAGLLVATALALLAPIGSADPLSYAAYGHMVTTGHDPYRTTPAQLAARDPVAAAVESPWQREPSVYGPLATGEQAVAAWIGGDDPAAIVLALDLLGAAAFAGAGILLLCSTTGYGRARAAALWCANPLLWLQLVAGAHLDVVVAAAVVGAVVAARRRPLVASALSGVAATVKPQGGLVWLAIAWPARRDPRRLLALLAAVAVVVVPAYAAAGTGAIHQLQRAGRRVSHGTPWRFVLDVLHAPRGLIAMLALVLAAGVALLIARGTAGVPAVALAVTTAYVLAAPYALPWYDALPWALLPLVALTWRDWVVLAHTTVLSLAYLPGRDAVHLHGTLRLLTHGMRSVVAPLLLAALLLGTAIAGQRAVSRPASS